MRSGEIWRYKNWLAKMIDSHMKNWVEDGYIPSVCARIVINSICDENIYFYEVANTAYEYTMQRATFVEIFEKDWRGNDEKY